MSGGTPRKAQEVDTDDVLRLVEDGAQLLEVLPPSAFQREHLPGARNVPLPQLTPEHLRDLDPERPVVVYCYDTECDLSARGAALLVQLGFAAVYDYRGSKTEWGGFGHPLEGELRAADRAGAVADPGVARCGADATIADVAEVLADGEDLAVVLDPDDVVIGAVRQEALSLAPSTPVVEAIDPGPPTVRPSIPTSELAHSMDEDGQDHVLVTTLDGRWVGLVRRDDLRRDA